MLNPKNTNLKIAIIGSHCVGKTTLAKALSTQLRIPYINGDIVRQLVTDRFQKQDPLDLTLVEYWTTELDHFDVQLSEATTHKTFVSDGGFILNPVYLGLTHKLNDQQQKYQNFKTQCIQHTLKQYSHLVYLPPEIPLVSDGFTPQDVHYRKQIDKFLLKILYEYKILYIKITGSVNKRVNQIIRYIHANLHPQNQTPA